MAVFRYFWMAWRIAEIKPCHFITVPAFLNTMIPLLGVSKFWNPNYCPVSPKRRQCYEIKTVSDKFEFLGCSGEKFSWVQTQQNRGRSLPQIYILGSADLNHLLFWIHSYTSSSTASILVRRDSAHSIPSWQFL